MLNVKVDLKMRIKNELGNVSPSSFYFLSFFTKAPGSLSGIFHNIFFALTESNPSMYRGVLKRRLFTYETRPFLELLFI